MTPFVLICLTRLRNAQRQRVQCNNAHRQSRPAQHIFCDAGSAASSVKFVEEAILEEEIEGCVLFVFRCSRGFFVVFWCGTSGDVDKEQAENLMKLHFIRKGILKEHEFHKDIPLEAELGSIAQWIAQRTEREVYEFREKVHVFHALTSIPSRLPPLPVSGNPTD